MFNLIFDTEKVNAFATKKRQRTSELKEKLNKVIENAKKKGIRKFIIEFEKPQYYSVLKRHLQNIKWSGKYDGYRITAILIEL